MKLPQINIRNKRASFDYELLDTFNAGIVLSGTEIKSIRLGKAGLNDSFCYVNNGEVWIKNGDVIAITTDRQGLDIAHFGIAFYVEGKLTLLHASSDEKKVVVSSKTLSQMLNDHDDWTGIRVLRIVE